MKTYIHYGSDHFDRFIMFRTRNADIGDLGNKPKRNTGLWGSPEKSERGWFEWCESEDYNVKALEKSFRFQVKNYDKVFLVNSHKSFHDLKEKYIRKRYNGRYSDVIIQYYNSFGFSVTDYIDFEKMMEDGYVGLELSITDFPEGYNHLYGWDVDSIVVFDPEEVVEVES